MSGFSLGPGKSGGGFSFLTPTSSTATSASSTPGFSFLNPTTTSAVTSAASTQGFSFLTPTTSTSTGEGFKFAGGSSIAPATSTQGAPSFSFALNTGTSTNSGTSNLNPPTTSSTGAIASSATTATVPSFGTGGLSFSKPATTTTSSVGFSFGTPGSSTGLSGGVTSTILSSATLTTTTTTTSFGASGAGGATNLSMRQLEEKLNKWLVELKEQEERFVRQAAHVNSWDQILQAGHDQVQSLKDTLHTVKSDQTRLEAEIDFIRGQQEELERLLEPLESATNANPATQLHQGDRQRDNMYYLAQSLDAQLRQMTDDLGKVIEHLNVNSGSWQPNDPVTLVARILSAHMDTLKWVDQNTSQLSQKIEDVSRVASNAGKIG